MSTSHPLTRRLLVSSAPEPFFAAEPVRLAQELQLLYLAHGVTGLLLYANGSVMEYIEGAADDVDAVLSGAPRDGLDHGHFWLDRAIRPQRVFEDWRLYSFHRCARPKEVFKAPADLSERLAANAWRDPVLMALANFWSLR